MTAVHPAQDYESTIVKKEDREARLAKNRELYQKRRSEETEEQKEVRLAKRREADRKRRLKKKEEASNTIPDSTPTQTIDVEDDLSERLIKLITEQPKPPKRKSKKTSK